MQTIIPLIIIIVAIGWFSIFGLFGGLIYGFLILLGMTPAIEVMRGNFRVALYTFVFFIIVAVIVV